MRRRHGITVNRLLTATVTLLGVVATSTALAACGDKEASVPDRTSRSTSASAGSGPPATNATAADATAADVTAADLAKVAGTRVFFGHQSVGMNILDGIQGVFRSRGAAAPATVQDRTPAGASGGFIVHAYLGQNEQPLTKIRDFEARLRGGLADQVDVAMMKLCYVDVTSGTDVDGLFTAYRDTMAALERDYPRVAFVKATVPLMSEPGLVGRIKTRVTGGDRYGVAENVARERLNALIRKEYAGDHLFDLAAIESTAPDGTRVAGDQGGRPYFALYDGYTTDRGHLNAEGSRRAATAWLKVVSQVTAR